MSAAALAAAQRAVELDPMDPDAHAALAEIVSTKGDLPRGEAEFETALPLNPGVAETLTHYADGPVRSASRNGARKLRTGASAQPERDAMGLWLLHGWPVGRRTTCRRPPADGDHGSNRPCEACCDLRRGGPGHLIGAR